MEKELTAEEQLAALRKSAVERQKRHKQKKKEEGYKSVTIELPPHAVCAWTELLREPDESLGGAIRKHLIKVAEEALENNNKSKHEELVAWKKDVGDETGELEPKNDPNELKY